MNASQQQRPSASGPERSPAAVAFVELIRTADLLASEISAVLKAEKISATQFNILRILRGAPEGLACGEIAARMITRDPDVTRLLDRLEKRGLVSRCRENQDRRLVLTRITEAGLATLGRLDDPVENAHLRQLQHLGPARLEQLTTLLRAARQKRSDQV